MSHTFYIVQMTRLDNVARRILRELFSDRSTPLSPGIEPGASRFEATCVTDPPQSTLRTTFQKITISTAKLYRTPTPHVISLHSY